MKPAAILYEELDRTLWITKHSRYNASHRLKRKNTLSIYSISILSVYVIAITLVAKYEFQVISTNLYDYASIVLALFILVISLTEASKNYMVSSERMFVCGNEIRDLLDELKKYAKKSDAECAGLEQLSCKYSSILKSCPENHDTIDFEFHKAQHYADFKGMNWYISQWYKLKYYLDIYWFYTLLIVLPPLIFLISI